MIDQIDIKSFKDILKKEQKNPDIAFVDVRTKGEYNSGHVKGLQNIPNEYIRQQHLFLGSFKKVYLMCRSGKRSYIAAETLEAQGLTNLVNVEGGLMAWEKESFPVTDAERSVLPLQQQLQIAISLFLLIGVLGQLFISSAFIWLVGFMAVGLMFAGLTGNCYMGQLLEKLPWNR